MAKRMSTASTIIDAAAPVSAVIGAYITAKLAMKSDRISREATATAERGSVEALAYTRATATLQGVIDSLQEEVDRWRNEADRLHQRLSQERENNDSLRAELRATEAEALRLNRELTELRTQLARLPADLAAQVYGTQQEGSKP